MKKILTFVWVLWVLWLLLVAGPANLSAAPTPALPVQADLSGQPDVDLDQGLEPAETEEAYGDFQTVDPEAAPLPTFEEGGAALLYPSGKPKGRFAELFAAEPREQAIPEDIPSIYNVPVVRNARVEAHIRFFHIAIRDRFEQWLERLGRYKPLVENIFAEFDLPSDLVFLSLVESGFNPHAYSRARATGPWQFMKGTARLYGLRVDRYVDERRDPIKSTVAAARYLRDLYDLFGTWPLAMAAYNAGEGKVLRALEKSRAENFWEVARTKYLRRETREYVPRFMAATIIARNPDQYGFPAGDPALHQFDEVIVHRPVHLRSVAALTGIPFVELRRLNPELRLDVTPPDVREYHLKVPAGTRTAVVQVLDRAPVWKGPVPTVKTVTVKGGKTRESGWYRVRVGDSLRSIAKRFHLTVAELKARNEGVGARIKPGDLLMIGPR